ncbi:MAG: hypothetical protein IPH88_11100 [Bacteroidales bacterium]|nr:hypothetical protein [Bacteroidales bacterium]
MKSLLILVLSLVSLSLFAQQKAWRDGEMEVRIHFREASEGMILSNLHINCDLNGNTALAYVTPSELEALKNAGLTYEITKADLNSWSKSFGAALVPVGYYTFGQIKNIADSLATNFPTICKKVVFGYNAQFQELAALKISDNADSDEAEPEIMFDGGIHGDEVGGSQNVIQFARDLCLAYGTDPDITGLIDNREIWLYYCVNPWGRDNMTRYNSASVDINRDNGFMWGSEGGSPGPFSQLETKALRNCQYQNQFVAYTNYHSGAETISYPWSYRLSPAPDEPSIDHLAQIYSAASGYPSLPYGQGSIIMYLIQGSTKDFNYGSLGSVAWSIEISLDKQPTDVQYYYNVNKPAMLEIIKHSGYGIQGFVTDAVTGNPVAASIFIGNDYPSYTDPVVGDFHRYLKLGTYTVKIVANGYESRTFENVVVSNLSVTNLDAALTPLASQHAYRVITSHIPSFNAQNPGDETYTAACLGPLDHVSYSIGRGGYVIVDMQDTIFDGPEGTFDITVYEGDSSPEGYTLYSGPSMDGPWTNLGYETGTASFDLGMFGVDNARYFMVMDDNNGQSNVNDAGFDLDAITCLHPAIPDTVGHLSGTVYDVFTGLPIEGVSLVSGFNTSVTDSAGFYSIEINRGESTICASLDGYREDCDTLQISPAGIYSHDFYLFSTIGKEELNALENTELLVVPNPCYDNAVIRFKLLNPEECRLRITDTEGKVIRLSSKFCLPEGEQNLQFKDFGIDFNTLPHGYYNMALIFKDKILVTKLIKAL